MTAITPKADRIRELLRTTKRSAKSIAKEVGCTPAHVMVIRRAGKASKNRQTVAQENKAKRQEAFLENLLTARGVVTDAARLTGISIDSPYAWIREDPIFKARVEEVKEMSIDFVESALFRQIENDVPASTIFFLKTRAKHRGYVERTEMTGPEGRPLEIRVIKPVVQFEEQEIRRLSTSDVIEITEEL